jgi:hypothetical protein
MLEPTLVGTIFILLEIAALCGTEDLRRMDMALFSYGARKLPFSN